MAKDEERLRAKVDGYTDAQYEGKLAIAQDGPLLAVLCLTVGFGVPLAIGARWAALAVVVVAALVLGTVAVWHRQRLRRRSG